MNSHTPSNDNSVGTPVIAAIIDPLEYQRILHERACLRI